jgi:hypothetical protein
MHTKFWSESQKGGDHLEDLGINEKIIVEWVLGKEGTRFIWLRTRTCDRLF